MNVAIAIFILPLNSALNPFLYTFNMILDRRRKEKERQILKYLETMHESPSVSNNLEADASLQHSQLAKSTEEGKVLAKKGGLAAFA